MIKKIASPSIIFLVLFSHNVMGMKKHLPKILKYTGLVGIGYYGAEEYRKYTFKIFQQRLETGNFERDDFKKALTRFHKLSPKAIAALSKCNFEGDENLEKLAAAFPSLMEASMSWSQEKNNALDYFFEQIIKKINSSKNKDKIKKDISSLWIKLYRIPPENHRELAQKHRFFAYLMFKSSANIFPNPTRSSPYEILSICEEIIFPENISTVDDFHLHFLEEIYDTLQWSPFFFYKRTFLGNPEKFKRLYAQLIVKVLLNDCDTFFDAIIKHRKSFQRIYNLGEILCTRSELLDLADKISNIIAHHPNWFDKNDFMDDFISRIMYQNDRDEILKPRVIADVKRFIEKDFIGSLFNKTHLVKDVLKCDKNSREEYGKRILEYLPDYLSNQDSHVKSFTKEDFMLRDVMHYLYDTSNVDSIIKCLDNDLSESNVYRKLNLFLGLSVGSFVQRNVIKILTRLKSANVDIFNSQMSQVIATIPIITSFFVDNLDSKVTISDGKEVIAGMIIYSKHNTNALNIIENFLVDKLEKFETKDDQENYYVLVDLLCEYKPTALAKVVTKAYNLAKNGFDGKGFIDSWKNFNAVSGILAEEIYQDTLHRDSH